MEWSICGFLVRQKLFEQLTIDLDLGMAIQQRLRSDKEGMAIVKSSLKLKNLISKGRVNGTLKSLTDNMHGGIMPLTTETLELLMQKHTKSRKFYPDILTQRLTRPIYPVAYYNMDELITMRASIIKDGSGLSGLDADRWHRILTYRAFGMAATVDLRKTFA